MSRAAYQENKNLDFLKTSFDQHLSIFQIEKSALHTLWDEIVSYYSQRHRAYHNLNHLYDIFTKLESHHSSIQDLPALQLAIWYHDIIYQALSKQNEIKSAMLCSKRLKENNIGSDYREKVFKLITSTKSHIVEDWKTKAEKKDNAYLLDLDLSILGGDKKQYELYTQQIRKEYKFVPSILYNRGRKKVLNHFLKMERIFKTDYFYEKYEKRAIENIKRELEK